MASLTMEHGGTKLRTLMWESGTVSRGMAKEGWSFQMAPACRDTGAETASMVKGLSVVE